MLIKYNKEKILINPFILSGNLYPLIDDGYGNMIENKNGIPVEMDYTNPVRISTYKRQVQKRDSSGTPVYVEQRVYYMISDNITPVDLRLEFVYNGISLKIMQRKELRKYNTLIGYEYELKNLTEGNFYA